MNFNSHLQAVHSHEPTVKALVGWNEEFARRQASRAGDGPLSGWALGVKDIIDVAGLPTRGGVDFLPGDAKSGSADIVERLESLGAYVFSKTVTTSLAYFDPGPTTNPWNSEHTPGGSSSGSAAAVAAGMVRFALGSQTIGSIGRPAAYCGVVGFKPGYERMISSGMIPFSPSVDTAGFFTANVADLQTVCAALFNEPIVENQKTLNVGLVEDLLCPAADPDMIDALRMTSDKLSALDGVCVQATSLPDQLQTAYDNHVNLVAAELAVSQAQLFEKYGSQYPPKVRELYLKGKDISDRDRQECLRQRTHYHSVLDSMFDRFDVLLAPSAPGAALKGLAITGDPRMNLIATHTRVPALTLPARLNQYGLPLGIQLLGRLGHDMNLLSAALRVESAIGFSVRPV
ncbi:MAG: amidase [Fuerstiella sp.]|nr:amidase [Fuerstiella sp.]